MWAEKTFRTNGHVAIGGISMGGFGALSVALQHPERFVAVLSFSGALFRKLPTGRSVYLGAFGYPGLTQARFTFVNPIDLARHGRADDQSIWLDCGVDDRTSLRAVYVKCLLCCLSVERHVAKFRSGRHSWDVWLEALEESYLAEHGFRRANKAAEPNSPSRLVAMPSP